MQLNFFLQSILSSFKPFCVTHVYFYIKAVLKRLRTLLTALKYKINHICAKLRTSLYYQKGTYFVRAPKIEGITKRDPLALV